MYQQDNYIQAIIDIYKYWNHTVRNNLFLQSGTELYKLKIYTVWSRIV